MLGGRRYIIGLCTLCREFCGVFDWGCVREVVKGGREGTDWVFKALSTHNKKQDNGECES